MTARKLLASSKAASRGLRDDAFPCLAAASTTRRTLSDLRGFIPSIPTPFKETGQIDFSAFESYCHAQIENGVSAIAVCDAVGEAATLTVDEQNDLIAAARSVAGSRITLIAGAGSNATSHAIELSSAAERAGADCVLSVVPYYNKPTQAGLIAHFTAIADATNIPVILSDVPSRTVTALSNDSVATLASHPQIIGMSDAAGDVTRCSRLLSLVGDDFVLLSGDDTTTLAYLAQGGMGSVSVVANIAPELCRKLYEALQGGQLTRACSASQHYTILTSALDTLPVPAAIKFALHRLGWMRETLRLPLTALKDTEMAFLMSTLNELSAKTPSLLLRGQFSALDEGKS